VLHWCSHCIPAPNHCHIWSQLIRSDSQPLRDWLSLGAMVTKLSNRGTAPCGLLKTNLVIVFPCRFVQFWNPRAILVRCCISICNCLLAHFCSVILWNWSICCAEPKCVCAGFVRPQNVVRNWATDRHRGGQCRTYRLALSTRSVWLLPRAVTCMIYLKYLENQIA
jgi:hypothetical protein